MADEQEALQRENRRLRAEHRALRAENERFSRRVAALEARVAELTQLLEEARRAGKQQAAPSRVGRPRRIPSRPAARRVIRALLVWPPAHVDETIHVPLGGCPHCGGPVDDRREHEQFVTDLPPVRPQVRRYLTESGYCRRCGRRIHGRHPDQISAATGAAGSQVGPHVVALAAALKHGLGVPSRKVAGVLFRDRLADWRPGGLVVGLLHCLGHGLCHSAKPGS